MKIDIELSEETGASIRRQAELNGTPVADHVLEVIEQLLLREEDKEAEQ
jgi:hypothetical protein